MTPMVPKSEGDGAGAARLHWADEELELLPARGLHWPRRRTLLIADPHFGKAASFRAAGVPVPEQVTRADLARLSRLLAGLDVQRLVILGDFLHARRGRSAEPMAALDAWRREWAGLELLLVRGNHDHSAGDPPEEWGLRVVDTFHDGPFCFCHDAIAQKSRRRRIGGHLHPTVRLQAPGGGLTASCFWFTARTATLPAFGSFTGGHRISPQAGDRVFAVGPGEVIEIPIAVRRRRASRTA